MTATIGLLHPGEMGCAIGAQLQLAGHRVVWASQGRGPATAARADAAGLMDVGSVSELCAQSTVILSICPPAAALETARAVAGFDGVYLDANAVSPAMARAMADVISAGGGTFVDGGIIGRPPVERGDVRLYLSGDAAREAATLFANTVIDAPVISERIGAASAMKLAYAAWTKGIMALLIATHEFAVAEQVDSALEHEWANSLPQLPAQHVAAVAAAAAKGWRWVGEMDEIASAFDAAHLPTGFHHAASVVFGRERGPVAPLDQSQDQAPVRGTGEA